MLDSLIFTNILIRIARHGRLKAPVGKEKCRFQFIKQMPLDRNLTSSGFLRVKKAKAERTWPRPCSLQYVNRSGNGLVIWDTISAVLCWWVGSYPPFIYLRNMRDEGTNSERPPKCIYRMVPLALGHLLGSRRCLRKGRWIYSYLVTSLHVCDLSTYCI